MAKAGEHKIIVCARCGIEYRKHGIEMDGENIVVRNVFILQEENQ